MHVPFQVMHPSFARLSPWHRRCIYEARITSSDLVGAVLPEGVRFDEFSSPLVSACLALGIGTAGALATGDDVGRRELIGLATAPQLADGLSLAGLLLAASLTYVCLRLYSRSMSDAERGLSTRRQALR